MPWILELHKLQEGRIPSNLQSDWNENVGCVRHSFGRSRPYQDPSETLPSTMWSVLTSSVPTPHSTSDIPSANPNSAHPSRHKSLPSDLGHLRFVSPSGKRPHRPVWNGDLWNGKLHMLEGACKWLWSPIGTEVIERIQGQVSRQKMIPLHDFKLTKSNHVPHTCAECIYLKTHIKK